MSHRSRLRNLERTVTATAAAVVALVAAVTLGYLIADRDEPPRIATYRTVGLANGEHLHLREGPGVAHPSVGLITAPYGGVVHLAGTVSVESWDWWRVRLPDGRIGWVNAAFLTPE